MSIGQISLKHLSEHAYSDVYRRLHSECLSRRRWKIDVRRDVTTNPHVTEGHSDTAWRMKSLSDDRLHAKRLQAPSDSTRWCCRWYRDECVAHDSYERVTELTAELIEMLRHLMCCEQRSSSLNVAAR